MVLEEDDPEIVAAMIKFLYTQDYDDKSNATKVGPAKSGSEVRGRFTNKRVVEARLKAGTKVVSTGEELITNAKVYVIADKYDIQPLKELAAQKYENVLAEAWNSPYFASSLKILYEQTPASDVRLKKPAIARAASHITDLMKHDGFLELCKTNGEICFEALKESVSALDGPTSNIRLHSKPSKRGKVHSSLGVVDVHSCWRRSLNDRGPETAQ